MSETNGRRIRYDILGQLVLAKRSSEEMSLRALEAATGISASTLSRIENGKPCDTDHVAALARWLDVKPERFMLSVKTENLPRVVRAMLLADTKIGKHEAEALSGTFGTLYRQMTARR